MVPILAAMGRRPHHRPIHPENPLFPKHGIRRISPTFSGWRYNVPENPNQTSAYGGTARMGEIIQFKRPSAGERHRGKTLCRHGHHKWVIDKERVFDTRAGRLVTRFLCSRCGAVKTRAL
jgi:hypothetical protein